MALGEEKKKRHAKVKKRIRRWTKEFNQGSETKNVKERFEKQTANRSILHSCFRDKLVTVN